MQELLERINYLSSRAKWRDLEGLFSRRYMDVTNELYNKMDNNARVVYHNVTNAYRSVV